MRGYCRFLQALFESGRVTVPELFPIDEKELREGDRLLVKYEALWRRELPATPPVFVPQAARWAAVRFFRAAQLAVYREYDQGTCERELGERLGVPPSPGVHYSVDLVLHYLPDLVKLVHRDDPLMAHLRQWAREWPLSSVGIPDVGEVSTGGFAQDDCLIRVYADRILIHTDESRLACPAARRAVRCAVGYHVELSGALRESLERGKPEESIL